LPSEDDAIATRLTQVRGRIEAIALRCQRSPGDIRLLAVSKTKPPRDIVQAHQAGQTAFGENYVQEALRKMHELRELGLEWHFIGRLQSNKTRLIAEHFAWVHSLAELHHAQRLAAQRPEPMKPLQVCIQVNTSGEPSKAGIDPQRLAAFAFQVAALPQLCLRGLMAMPNPENGPAAQRAEFRRLREMRDHLIDQGLPLDTLSMGMSGDLEAAICEGSTMVRVGTAIFGPRV
jgi:pyridoxal phosphate enzyme (YggS family)